MLLRHTSLGRHGITAAALLLRHIILVSKSLLLVDRHVARVHLGVLRDSGTRLLGGHVLLLSLLLRGINGLFNAVFVAAGGLGSVEAGLNHHE